MGMRAVAEFVEDGEILERLNSMGVDYAQGFAVGKSVALDEALANAA